MPVHQIVRMLANGDTVEAVVAENPFLSREITWPLSITPLAWPRNTPIEVDNL
jgi:hypothetical protein